jgi:hypothetical protein
MKNPNLDAKMVAHILGGAWAKFEDLEGNSDLNSLNYLINYLPDSSHLKPKLEFTKDIINHYMAHEHNKYFIRTECNSLVKEIIEKLKLSVNNLSDNPQDMVIITGGWTGLPKNDYVSIDKHSGHAMYYVIKKDLHNIGKFIFEVINAGAGLQYHDHKATKKGKNKYSFTKKWHALNLDQIYTSLEQLLPATIKPLGYEYNENIIGLNKEKIKEERQPYYYDEHKIYKILEANLPKENLIQVHDWITPQRIGNCTWKALMMVIRNVLGKDDYKRFINNLKLNALNELLGNLIDDPKQYGENHFLMITALKYGAQKIAKTLEKRKELFTIQQLTEKTNQVSDLLKQAEWLEKDYLKANPGKLKERLVFSELNIDYGFNNRKAKISRLMKYKLPMLSDELDTNLAPSKTNILIPKLYNHDEISKITPEDFLNELDVCLEYIKKIEHLNKESLRTFLTQNVFNRLPIPPVFWDRFNVDSREGIQQMVSCLEKLEHLSEFYIKTIIKEQGTRILPEYKYNFAKLLGIGKYLTEKYTNSILAQDLVQKDNFVLLGDSGLPQETKSLDPYSGIEWQKLTKELFKEETLFKFIDSIYLDQEIPLDKFTQSPEYSMFLRLSTILLPQFNDLYDNTSYALKLMSNQQIKFHNKSHQTLMRFIKILQNFEIINNVYLAYENKPPQQIKVDISTTDDKVYIELNAKKPHEPDDTALLNNLFNNNLLENYKYEKTDNGQASVINNHLNRHLLPDFYDLQLIQYSSNNNKRESQVQLVLLLDYFESLTETRKNKEQLLDFFKQSILFNIENVIKQMQDHPPLTDRLINFFNKELSLINYQELKVQEENVNDFLNRYVVLQRTANKIYSFLKESKQQTQYLYNKVENILMISRKNLFKLLTGELNLPTDDFDKGKIAAYGLASFNGALLTEEDCKMSMLFSSYIGIYGFGKGHDEYDLLLKKDAYDVRLKIAEYIQNCDHKKRTELLDFCLTHSIIKAVGFEIKQPLQDWKESFPCYFTYDGNNNLIQMNVIEGTTLIRGIQFTRGNVPEEMLKSEPYKNLFDETVIEIISTPDGFVPTYLPWQNVLIKKSNIFLDQNQYVLLKNEDVENLKLPNIIIEGKFTYWIKLTENPKEYEILIVPKNIKKGLKPFLKILPDGRIVKLNNDDLSLSSANNYRKLKSLKHLGVNSKNVLVWQNKQNIITKIEIPIGDNEGNWLSFERKTINNVDYWSWTKDPAYFISATQILNQRPSISNFILLENSNGQQKVLFANLQETINNKLKKPYVTLESIELNEIYPDVGGLPEVNYIEIDIKQTVNERAELIGSSNVCDLSHLYIVYLNIMQPENDPADAAVLLNKQRPLRRYTILELTMLWQIINSEEEQKMLQREQLHPDTAVVKLLALYLLRNNLEKYPFSEQEKKVFQHRYFIREITNEKKLRELAATNYAKILQLPAASGRSRLSEFLSDADLNNLGVTIFAENKQEFKKLPAIKDHATISLKAYHVTKEELENLDLSLNNNLKLLAKQRQEIYDELNNNIEQIEHFKRKRMSGHLYELTMDDAISLYLKQDVALWEEHTGLTEIHKIHDIQDKIIKYLLLQVKIQQMQRLLDIELQLAELDPSSKSYKILNNKKQGLIDNEKKHTYDPRKYPAFLVYEVLSNIMLWPKQIDAFKKLLAEQKEKYPDQQLEIFMGMGKSKVISPLLSYVKADGEHLSVLTLTEPLYNSGSADMQKSLSLLNAQVETIKFSRHQSSLEQIKKLEIQIKQAITKGVTCVTKVKDLQSIDAMPEVFLEEIFQAGVEYTELSEEQKDKIKTLININNIIKKQGLFTLDELDTQLYSRHQLNLPIGHEERVPSVGIEVAIELFSMLLAIEKIDDTPIKQLKKWLLNNNQTFLSRTDFAKIKSKLAELIFSKLQLTGNKLLADSDKEKLQDYFKAYLGVEENTAHAELFYDILKQSDSNLANKLAMYKMQLADGKLQESLSKSANTQFGRSKLQNNLEIVIPYAANNLPKESSSKECAFFKDPWETINKTLLFYIATKWQDLDQTKKFILFLASSNDREVDEKLKIIFSNDIPNILELLKTKGKKLEKVMPEIKDIIERERQAGNEKLFSLLFDYLKQSVFSEQIKAYPVQASSTSQDFAAQPYKLNGYSGTRLGEKTWHKRIKTDEFQGSDKDLNNKILLSSNGCFGELKYVDPENLIKHVKDYFNIDEYSSFIDAGALFKGRSNREIAKILLDNLPNKEAIAFYDEITPGVIKLSLMVKDNLNKPIVVEGSSPEQIAKALQWSEEDLGKKLFNFYDQAHIVGSDLPNPPQARAFMTFSEQLGKDLMNQGIMRMRKFKEDPGQRIDFLVPEEVNKIILKNLGKNQNTKLEKEHLIDHANLVQEEQEKLDYFDALHQKLQHEIKNHLIIKIRNLLSSDQFELALKLYKKIRGFILVIDEGELFDKYGQLTQQAKPIENLKQKFINLKNKLAKLDEENNEYQLELNVLEEELQKIIKNLKSTDLPNMVSTNSLGSGGEVSTDMSVEQQQEQQQEQQGQPLTPINLKDKLGKKPDKYSYLEYLQTINLNQNTKQLKSILLEKKEAEQSQELQYQWQAYRNIIKDNIYYSNDSLTVFEQINSTKGALTKYGKPVHQVLIVEEPGQQLKLIVLSMEESENFASDITKARAEFKNQYGLLKDRKIWLVSPNGNALDGTEEWINPFEHNNSKQIKPFRDLLLQALILQKNAVRLNEILKNEPADSDIIRWFGANQHNIKEIFGKEKFTELTQGVKNIEHLLVVDTGLKHKKEHLAKIMKELPVVSEENKEKSAPEDLSHDSTLEIPKKLSKNKLDQ